jgi:hypothetical protein
MSRRWFGTCSCKPVPRGRPSSAKQLRTSSAFRPFAVLVAHCNRVPVLSARDWFAFSCSAVLEAAAHEENEKSKNTPTKDEVGIA